MSEQRMRSTRREDFDALLPGRPVVPVVRVLFADGETPVGLYRKLAAGRAGTFLLESAEQGGVWSRFSFVGVGAFGVLSQEGDHAAWRPAEGSRLHAERLLGEPVERLAPLEAVSAVYRRWASPAIPGHPPLTGGLVGYIGWEAVRQLERLPDAPPADYAVPGQALVFASELLVLDHREGTVALVANCLNDGAEAPQQLWDDAQARLDALQDALARPAAVSVGTIDMDAQPAPRHRTRKEDFLAAVATAKDRIRDGDIFQVVISQRFEQECTADPLEVYRALRVLNPSPYMYLLSLASPAGPYAVVGSSPEALVKVTERRVMTHPIAGSKPRGRDAEEDRALEAELLSDEKERAEHLMLVDLARNDLLRVCEAPSVAVTEFMRIERFSHIMHLVSTVEGTLREGRDAVDVFRATFPAGTLSGAPKPRALQIIDELEPAQRGVYGGVVGYFGLAGDADLAIAIRTATIMDSTAYVQAGGGLVADSDPLSEYRESQNKAAAPLRAVAVANSFREV